MNRSQKIALALGMVWALVTLLLPPVHVPAIAAAKAYDELSRWNSPAVQTYGVNFPYFVLELTAIVALIAGLVYFLKTPPARRGSRRRTE